MKRRYDPGFVPPAPMIDVRLVSVEGRIRTTPAKLDSGADLSAVPRDLIELAGLLPERLLRAASFHGDFTDVHLYRIALEIDGLLLEGVDALATRRPYVILGRNVLRHFVTRLDGPAETLTRTAGSNRTAGRPSKRRP